MYKVFSGDKCVVITARAGKTEPKSSKVVVYTSAEALHKEYRQFVKASKLEPLVVHGDAEKAWKVFRSLFSYIEAAGGLVVNPKGELLMIYRNKHWDIPKGKMEAGESPDQTAIREVEEECGIKNLKIVKSLQSTYHTFHQSKHDCINLTYWFEMTRKYSEKPNPQKEEGTLAAKSGHQPRDKQKRGLRHTACV